MNLYFNCSCQNIGETWLVFLQNNIILALRLFFKKNILNCYRNDNPPNFFKIT
jgi:hypothetical protein